MKKWAEWLLVLANAAILIVFVITTWNKAPEFGPWDYKDVVSLLLAIVTTVLAALGIILAVGAFWGYQKIADHATERAEKAVDAFLNSDKFYAKVKAIASEQMANNMRPVVAETINVTPPGDQPQQAGAPGDEPWQE